MTYFPIPKPTHPTHTPITDNHPSDPSMNQLAIDKIVQNLIYTTTNNSVMFPYPLPIRSEWLTSLLTIVVTSDDDQQTPNNPGRIMMRSER